MITRYEINEYGELPLSTGRYVRWEDFDDVTQELLMEIDTLKQELMCKDENYSVGWDDGYEEGKQEGIRVGTREVERFKEQVIKMAEILDE